MYCITVLKVPIFHVDMGKIQDIIALEKKSQLDTRRVDKWHVGPEIKDM